MADMSYFEPWRCAACSMLVYNKRFIDGDWYPVEGAPPSKFISTEYPKVCNVCWDLHLAVQSDYWCDLQKRERERRSQNNKLRPGENYLA